MKKIVFSVITLIIILLSVEISTSCPLGFQGPFTKSVPLSPTCSISFDWCCGDVVTLWGTKKGIHFAEIRIIGDCTGCITYAQDQFGNMIPTIPWDKLIAAIYYSHEGCFPTPPYLEPCEPPDPNDFNYMISTGGCYRLVNDLSGRRYVPCDPDRVEYCYEKYRLCWAYEEPEIFVDIQTEGSNPAFQCGSQDCFPLCAH